MLDNQKILIAENHLRACVNKNIFQRFVDRYIKDTENSYLEMLTQALLVNGYIWEGNALVKL